MKTTKLFTGVIAAALILTGCADKNSSKNTENRKKENAPVVLRRNWEQIKESGRLRILTPPGHAGFLSRDAVPRGFEQDMAAECARQNDLEPIFVEVPAYDSILPWLAAGRGDVAAASLTRTAQREEDFLPTRPLRTVREYLVGRAGDSLQTLADLSDFTVHIRPGSSYESTLDSLADSAGITPEIKYVDTELHTEEILNGIAEKKYTYTLCDLDIARAVMAYLPGIDTLMPVSDYRDVCWYVRPDGEGLKKILDTYLKEHAVTGEVNRLSRGDMDSIQSRGVIRFVTRNNAASYWIYRGEEVGFDFELMKAFARKHNLTLRLLVADDRRELLSWIAEGRADIAAATITATDARREDFAFSAPYMKTREVPVWKEGTPPVASVADFAGRTVAVRRGSAYEKTLDSLLEVTDSSFKIQGLAVDTETEEILWDLAEGHHDLTICDRYLAGIEQNHGRPLKVGPPVSGTREIAWALRRDNPRLQAAVDSFFTTGKYRPRSLHYNMLYNKYFARKNRAQAYEMRADIHNRLSVYDTLIRDEAQPHTFDWRLVAAQIFQESRFDPNAQSWVGATGLMQLMPATARQYISGDIRDPEKNIYAGVSYLNYLMNRFSRDIPRSERFSFALASYNAGYGHVLDARRLARRLGYDPDRWPENVERTIALLAKPEYYRTVRYGYCRGSEPVVYVRNIKKLYENYRQIVE
ncbi:MAG: transporter substrate-binding domain-containing protein [Fibrobacterota bacterium]